MNRIPRLSDLSAKRSELKGAGQYREAIPFQHEIIELLELKGESQNKIAGAHNMASVLYLGAKLFSSAEWHARQALALHSGETIDDHERCGAYYLVLARALAGQYEFDQAATCGEKSVSEFAWFHNPPDEFISTISTEVESMRNRTWAFPE